MIFSFYKKIKVVPSNDLFIERETGLGPATLSLGS